MQEDLPIMGRYQFTVTLSHPHRPRPGRRHRQFALYPYFTFPVLIVTIALLTPTLAETGLPHRVYNYPLFGGLEERGVIRVDQQNPPCHPCLQQRQDNADPFDSTAVPLAAAPTEPASSTTTTTTSESASATSAGNAVTSIEAAPSSTGAPSPLPSPFDTSLGSNFTSRACPDFFRNFLNNATFQDCHPTSLLLQNSNSFFTASRSPDLLSQSLDASCGVSLAQCSPLMASLASQLVQDANCGQDYRNGNPLVTQAHGGMVSYEPLYRATCLTNSATGNYCFADAITNTTNPADSYPYYTALGTNLPAATRPNCDQCLQDVMNIFAGYAVDRNQPVAAIYTATAQQISLGCGPGFVNTTVPAPLTSNEAAKQRGAAGVSTLIAFLVAVPVACLAF